jgi:molybdopterin converting factor small subunit
MIVVRLPSMLRRKGGPAELKIQEPVSTIAELIPILEKRIGGFAAALEDGLYSFAVNDSLLLQSARQHALAPGDIVELVPAIAGG